MQCFLKLLLLLSIFVPGLRGADDPLIAAVRAADDERVAATIDADPVRLAAILSPELYYAHSNGSIDTNASFREKHRSQRTVYRSIKYAQRDFLPAGPGVVLMSGRALVEVSSQGNPVSLDLNFLAVWRTEGGQWKFLAWQSCKNPPAASQ